jgi:hypothetical protein
MNFLPKNIFEQLHRIMTVWFIFVASIQILGITNQSGA